MNFWIISIVLFIWPFALAFYKLYRYYTWARVDLPCGSFKIKRAFRYDMNVMTRIVSVEFFNGGNVDPEIMEALYRRYGPISWKQGKNRLETFRFALLAYLRRYTPDLFPKRERFEQE